MIVIPAIDIRDGQCVRLTEGDPTRQTTYGTDPVTVAMRFQEQGAQWLHVVDLDAALGTGSNADTMAAISAAVTIPVQVGGGLRNREAIEAAFRRGAARVVIGTTATDPAFVRNLLESHGGRLVVAMDVRGGQVMTHGWQREGPPVEALVRHLDRAGCTRYLVTAIASDGRLAGPDLSLYERVRSLTDRPIVASGGVSSARDLQALSALELEGVVVGKAFHEGRLSLADAMEAVAP